MWRKFHCCAPQLRAARIFPVSHSLCVRIARCDCSRALARRKTRTEIVVATPYNDNIDIIQDSPAQLLISLTMQSLSHTRYKGRILSRSRYVALSSIM